MKRALSAPSSLPTWLRSQLTARGEQTWLLALYVQPNAKQTVCLGLHDTALKIRLNAPAIDGKANQALLQWLQNRCRQLQAGTPQLHLRQGERSRYKCIELQFPQAVTPQALVDCITK
ncbi:DUF167 domain-containing protein [Parvibium lacunae]|uniref:UPF0235 protein DU000_09050 n=1 Tax=Parvibium lacunae TaxID=1888893 RepID=A0A368L1Z4_9BURK|nr:DUF167 domain-containing protein [Parvibium lacunae]RCS57575.1 DUF167 domain-containing protein [Parvibium lacunae]